MFKKERLPVGALFMVLVLALAFVGVGYGLWSEVLYIDGTVETGDVDVEFGPDPQTSENDHGKDVGNCDAYVTQIATPNDHLVIDLTNTYPSYECWVTFDVISTGSIPVHIYQPDFTDLPPTTEVTVNVETCYPDDTQVHQGDSESCTIYIHVEQGAQEDSEYTFSAEVEARQFNEPR